MFYSSSLMVMTKWKDTLKTLILQVGFQEHYSLLKPIGKGVTSKVCLARRRHDGKDMAVKIFDRKGKSANQGAAIMDEIRMLRLLNHDNILTFEEGYMSSECIYIVS